MNNPTDLGSAGGEGVGSGAARVEPVASTPSLNSRPSVLPTGSTGAAATASVGQLAAALAGVQQELPRISKGETAEVPLKGGGSYSYSYADLASVAAAVLPLLGKHGLAFTAWPTAVDGRLVLRYHLLHKSGERMDGEYPLPSGASAQQLGSAITYARRYCLCAVTGVAPDDDDDAAKADGVRQAERAEEQAAAAAELNHAKDAVRGAWANHYGAFDQAAAGELYRTWSKGGTLTSGTAGQLRAFAAYLHALPIADAGSSPEDTAPPVDETSEPQEAAPDRPMSGRQRGKLFALLGDLNITERSLQLEYLASAIGRTIKSRGELTDADARVAIDALQKDLEEARATGLVPAAVSGD